MTKHQLTFEMLFMYEYDTCWLYLPWVPIKRSDRAQMFANSARSTLMLLAQIVAKNNIT